MVNDDDEDDKWSHDHDGPKMMMVERGRIHFGLFFVDVLLQGSLLDLPDCCRLSPPRPRLTIQPSLPALCQESCSDWPIWIQTKRSGGIGGWMGFKFPETTTRVQPEEPDQPGHITSTTLNVVAKTHNRRRCFAQDTRTTTITIPFPQRTSNSNFEPANLALDERDSNHRARMRTRPIRLASRLRPLIGCAFEWTI